MATFTNPDSIHRASVGVIVPALWGDTVNDDLNFLNTHNAARYWRSGAVTSAVASTLLTFDTLVYDPAGRYSTTTGLYTCLTAGLYCVIASSGVTATASGQEQVVHIMHNAAVDSESAGYITGAGALITPVSAVVSCAAADTLSIQWNTTTAGLANRAVSTETFVCFFQIGSLS